MLGRDLDRARRLLLLLLWLLLLLLDADGNALLVRRQAALAQGLEVSANPRALRQRPVPVDRPLNILHLQRTHMHQLEGTETRE